MADVERGRWREREKRGREREREGGRERMTLSQNRYYSAPRGGHLPNNIRYGIVTQRAKKDEKKDLGKEQTSISQGDFRSWFRREKNKNKTTKHNITYPW